MLPACGQTARVRVGRLQRAPSICSLPHSLHFSQPTQSMTLVMFWKWSCSCALSSALSAPFHMRPSSNGTGQACCSASLFTCRRRPRPRSATYLSS